MEANLLCFSQADGPVPAVAAVVCAHLADGLREVLLQRPQRCSGRHVVCKEQLGILHDGLEVGAGETLGRVRDADEVCGGEGIDAGEPVAQNLFAGRGVRQAGFQPQLDAAGSQHRRRQAAGIHRGHHDADAFRAGALQPVELREQIAVEAGVAIAVEDHVGIVDEDDAGRIAAGFVEDFLDLAVEIFAAGDDGSIDQEELAFETMRQGAADRGLAVPGGPANSTPRLGLRRSCVASASFSKGRATLASRTRITSSTPLRSLHFTGWTSSISTLLVMWCSRRYSMNISVSSGCRRLSQTQALTS